MRSVRPPVVVLAVTFAVAPVIGRTDPTVPPTPSPPSAAVSAEDELSPNYQSETGSSNIVNLRAQLPYDNSGWLLRVKLPIVTAAPAESITGAGDLALWDLAVINAAHGQWLIGATFRVPTARDSLGTNKYSLGPSAAYATEEGASAFGFAINSFFSVIGPSSFPGVAKTQIEPDFKYRLSGDWSVGLSSMQFTYDWVRNRWTDVPLGIRIGKGFSGTMKSFDAYFETEKNLAHTADTPGWTIRTLLRYKLSSPQNGPSDIDENQ